MTNSSGGGPPMITVEVGGVPIRVPVQESEPVTRGIAQRVNDAIARINKDSDRIDTYRFALEAAYGFAAQLARLEKQHTADLKEAEALRTWERQQVIQELAEMNESLARILKRPQEAE